MGGAKRRLAKHVQKKGPITNELLSKMFHSLYKPGNIKNQRINCACLLGYSVFFLRSIELLKLKRADILINSTYMGVFIESSKTNKYRDRTLI